MTAATSLVAQNVTAIDIAEKTDRDSYFIVFCGRNNSLTGHAFVAWGKEVESQQMSLLDGAFGLYPKSSNPPNNLAKMVFGKVPGEIVDEFTKGSITADLIRFVVGVDKEVYEKTLAAKSTWAGREDYQLIENDCVTFASTIAQIAGLTLPPRATLDRPWDYIAKFSPANPQSSFIRGEWQSSDTGKRFKLTIKATECTWIERNSTGAELVRTVPIKTQGKEYIIYRENDSEVLTFLGFQPTLRSQLLSKGVNPSFIVLERTGQKTLKGAWNGLVVIKDSNANLKEIKQPGSVPSKIFDFIR